MALSVTRCAASATVPNCATTMDMVRNAVELTTCSTAAGMPSLRIWRAASRLGSQPSAPRMETPLTPRHITRKRMAKPIRREMNVPHALPTAPSSGMPSSPKIRP